MIRLGLLGDLVADMLEGGFCFPVLCELAWGPVSLRPRKIVEAFDTLPLHVVRNFGSFMRRWDWSLHASIQEFDYYKATFIPARDAAALSIVIA